MIQFLFYIVTLLLFFSVGIVLADDRIVLGNFSGQIQGDVYPENWEPLFFDGVTTHTSYLRVHDGKVGSVQAMSQAGSSGMIRKIILDPVLFPNLTFSWKIQDIIASADLREKTGDDAPARVYITFAYDSAQVGLWERVKFEAIRLYYGEYPPVVSLVYVWASHCEQGTITESAYTGRVKIIVLESGASRKGQWITEERDIRADYKAAFGEGKIPMISGVAIMTDTDNTGEKAVAWYGDIIFSKPSNAIAP